jgi:NDP-sugar pyrophosphorylase family protein
MQAVILAGGKGTRLQKAVGDAPKAMAPVNGKPFLEHQLTLLRDAGVEEAVLCLGYKAEVIRSYFGDGSRVGLQLRYSVEEEPLGTGGALVNAAPFLQDAFLLTYGDAYLLLDYRDIMTSFLRSGLHGLMVVYKNRDQFDASNTVVADGRVVFYSKREKRPDMVFIDAGLSVFHRSALAYAPEEKSFDLSRLFVRLIEEKQMAAYETGQRFYEIGSPGSLEEFRRFLATRQ